MSITSSNSQQQNIHTNNLEAVADETAHFEVKKVRFEYIIPFSLFARGFSIVCFLNERNNAPTVKNGKFAHSQRQQQNDTTRMNERGTKLEGSWVSLVFCKNDLFQSFSSGWFIHYKKSEI